jgi:hypothetical protein
MLISQVKQKGSVIMSYITIEQAGKLFEDDDPQEVTNSIWKAHWNNAKNTNSITVLNNLLKNHVRLLNTVPERNNENERKNIIEFIQNKILVLERSI